MTKTIAIKDFRNNISAIADKVGKGQEFIVLRRSKPAFKVVPVDIIVDDEDYNDGSWETVVDFTEGGKIRGVKVEDVLKAFKKLNS